uniref:Sperm-tail PG-rich repeat containing 1 n=1 Tax=Amphilophus citrinellus TaxID=61819 RepID=A0A3Q0SGZ1_AMPCI
MFNTTKNQTAVTTHQEKKGFSSQAKRFTSQVSLNENPGRYDCFSSNEVNSPSFSKKGTTGFASRRPQRVNPGPNAYNLQSSFIKKYDNTGVSRVFRLPIAVQMDGPKHITPAPNQYDVYLAVYFVSFLLISSVVGTSSFLSRTARDSFCPNKNVPSPGHYEVRSSLIQGGSKVVLSPFRSKTHRIPPLVDHRVPGPGAYSPYQAPAPVKKTMLLRRYYLAIAAPPQTVPKDPPSPGPGQYDIGKCDWPSKQSVPTAAFASRTQRIPQNLRADEIPGPGFYNPQLLSKQCFCYNDSRVWIPV